MDTTYLLIIGAVLLIALIALTYILTKRSVSSQVADYKSVLEAISKSESTLEDVNNSIEQAKNKVTSIESDAQKLQADAANQLEVINDDVSNAKKTLAKLDAETKELQTLKSSSKYLSQEIEGKRERLRVLWTDIDKSEKEAKLKESEFSALIGKLDLYSKVDEYVANGFFEIPDYLYQTSARFTEEIKRVREKQKELIKGKEAISYPESTVISSNKSYNKKILDGQVKLMLNSFNIECDALIGKVRPSNFSRTLEQIEKMANSLEKGAATLHCGFNLYYIKLKYEECQLQYQFTLKKEEEQAEQRTIRDQIREEQKAIKEYERAILQAEKEEKMYSDMLEVARKELSNVSDEDRAVAEERISDLEQQLAEAKTKEERAKSMAEQTRKGHVYVISNVGSFGDDIYKIGLTRRLEPMDRVKELGDASVPFSFDVHAMIYVEDAPALESALHREFTHSRVNAVNLRKEFFKTDLQSIKQAVEKIAGIEAEFTMTAIAEDYYESRRLQAS